MSIARTFSKPTNLLICLLVLVTISRIPLFYPDSAILDGDEAILGLMSFSQLENGEMPWFFWGQRYGFTFVEVSAISCFQFLLGYHDYAVKLAMLCLWLITIAGMFLFLKGQLNAKWAFVLVLVFAMHPTWYIWSIKARGGYHTAMLFSSWLFYFLSRANLKFWLKAALAGLCLAVIYHAMKLWFPPVMLIALYLLWVGTDRKGYSMLILTCVYFIMWAILYRLSVLNPDYWKPEVSDISLFFRNLFLFQDRLSVFLKGHYFLGDYYLVKEVTVLTVSVGVGLVILAIILHLLRWRSEGHALRLLFLIAALVCLGPLLITNEFFSYRYLLPFPFFLIFWIALQFKDIRFEKVWLILFLAMAVLFSIGSVQITHTEQFKKLSGERIGKMELANRLMEDGYQHVFSSTTQTPWQLMYFSQFKIICSGIYYHDRLEYIPKVVRDAYHNGESVPVLAGDPKEHLKLEPGFEPYGIQYIIKSPDTTQLKKLAFDLYVPKSKF